MKVCTGVMLLLVACTKPNPNLCCIDQADCEAHGIETGRTCQQGEVCRNNACIVETCTLPTDCDSQAPFCQDGACTATCSTNDQCPIASGDPSARVCAGGACVECAADGDCPENAPVCEHAACRACEADAECGSKLCGLDGSCALETDIAYVSPAGSAGTNCDQISPCTLSKGVAIGRPYVKLADGAYTGSTTLAIMQSVTIVGDSTLPIITNTGTDAVLTVGPGASLGLDRVAVSGGGGAGIACTDASAGQRAIALRDAVISNNAGDGIEAHICTISMLRTTISGNGGDGVNTADGTSTIDRCTFESNHGFGLLLDDGVYSATNSFFVRNSDGGLYVYSEHVDIVVAFNTIVDNQTLQAGSAGFDCAGTIVQSAPNNIVARNGQNLIPNSNCSLPGTLVSTTVADLHFASPDVAPYDYHLAHGSVAIDAATAATLDHDFDGDVRPKGNGRDLGADEAE